MLASEVAARAKAYSAKGTFWGVGYCLRFARTCAGAPGGVSNAYLAWMNAKRKHISGTPPKGAMVFWSGGAKKYGHVAVSAGGGRCWSTDIDRPGKVDLVGIAELGARWPNLKLIGWTEDINGTTISGLTPPPPAQPKLHVGDLAPSKRNAAVKTLQIALRQRGYARLNPSGATGYFGTETRAMVRAFQHAQGWRDGDADGLVDLKTLQRLGLG